MTNGRKIEAMHRKFGTDPQGRKCKDCANLVRVQPSDRHYWKCTQYGVSCGESTDWRVGYPACGCINRESGEYPVIDQLKHKSRAVIERQEIEGQMMMEV